LPDELAALAEKQGLLSPAALEAYIKDRCFKEREEYRKDAPGKPAVPLLSLRGSCKGIDTMDAYFERKRADKALEEKK
jgi:hypothetical protein